MEYLVKPVADKDLVAKINAVMAASMADELGDLNLRQGPSSHSSCCARSSAAARRAHAGQAVATVTAESGRHRFRIGEEQFVANRDEVREVLMLPGAMTRCRARSAGCWGIANLRGHLLPLIDVKLMLGSGRTTNCGARPASSPSTTARCRPARRRRGARLPPLHGSRTHEQTAERDHRPLRPLSRRVQAWRRRWPVFSLFDLVESNLFAAGGCGKKSGWPAYCQG